MKLKQAKRFVRTLVYLATMLLFTDRVAFAQGGATAPESWMTQREAAAASQRNLERLADQARQRNSPNPRATLVMPTAEEQRAAQLRAREDLVRAEAQRQRAQDERAAIQAQQRQALERRFAEIDVASAALADLMFQQAQARLAIAQPLLAEGPTSRNLTAYCDALSIYTQDYIQSDPVLVVRSLEMALRIDEAHPGCWQRYSELTSLLSPTARPLFKRIDYRPLGFTPRDQEEAGRIIKERYQALKTASDRRQAAVATYIDPARRLSPPQLPAQFSNWQRLRSMRTPEARYWQFRVHALGLLGQPVNQEAAKEAACSRDGQSFYRNQLNCMIRSMPPGPWSTQSVSQLKTLVGTMVEPRNPDYYQGPERRAELAQIMSRRADRAAALSIYSSQAFIQSQTGPGTLPLSSKIETAETVAKYYQKEACQTLEEAISLGHYDSGRDVYNLLACYDRGEIPAPTGARDRVFAVLESEGNASLRTYVLDALD
jgi:hypothetical protein